MQPEGGSPQPAEPANKRPRSSQSSRSVGTSAEAEEEEPSELGPRLLVAASSGSLDGPTGMKRAHLQRRRSGRDCRPPPAAARRRRHRRRPPLAPPLSPGLQQLAAAGTMEGDVAREHVLTDNNLLSAIFGHLCLEDLCRAARVRACWRAVTNNQEFWQTINLKGRTIVVSKARRGARGGAC